MAILKHQEHFPLVKQSPKNSELLITLLTPTTYSSLSVALVLFITLWLFYATVVTVCWWQDLDSLFASLFARIWA